MKIEIVKDLEEFLTYAESKTDVELWRLIEDYKPDMHRNPMHTMYRIHKDGNNYTVYSAYNDVTKTVDKKELLDAFLKPIENQRIAVTVM